MRFGLIPFPNIIKTYISRLKMSHKKGKVHPCTGTEAMYRPYDP